MPIDGIACIFDGVTLGKQVGRVHGGDLEVLILEDYTISLGTLTGHNELTLKLLFTSSA